MSRSEKRYHQVPVLQDVWVRKSHRLHQIRTQKRIQLFVPNLRFLLLFRGNFTLFRYFYLNLLKMYLLYIAVTANLHINPITCKGFGPSLKLNLLG